MKTIGVYYESKIATVRMSIQSDCAEIAKRMRKSDIEEIWASHRLSPIEATMACFKHSQICLTIERNGFPVAMFGIVAENLCGDKASIWLSTTDGIIGIGRTFVRRNRIFIDYLLTMYPILYSYVDLRNTVSIKWLKYLGAEFGKIVKCNDDLPFQYFEFRRTQ